MKTLSQIQMEAYKLYKSLQVGRFFDTYHDTMLDLMEQIGYLEHDLEGDFEKGLGYLGQMKAIHKAQQLLIKAKIQ